MKSWRHSKQARWKKTHPWARFVEWARRRVRCPDEKQWYPFYGAKGIECTLKASELEEIWVRDRASEWTPLRRRRSPSAR